jgi:2-oxoglutarate dehydrogenase E2 component (dihydrolipoamide succinyltransferase)
MAVVDLIMPKMGESIMEATILKWLKQPGDSVKADESVLEIATDKVDSEVPSSVEGVLDAILYNANDVVPVGTVIARIRTQASAEKVSVLPDTGSNSSAAQPIHSDTVTITPNGSMHKIEVPGARFYSPLVLNIAQREGISMAELEKIPGTGNEGRVTKKDIIDYLQRAPRATGQAPRFTTQPDTVPPPSTEYTEKLLPATHTTAGGNVEIIEMDRMRKLIARHMVESKHTSAHVTSFTEADVTHLVQWRERIKKDFEKNEKEKITLTPLFIEAIVKCLKRYPLLNSSIDGDRILVRKDIHIGMATALPSGNLIVPVIKSAEQLNLVGLTKQVNALSQAARANRLRPEDTAGGTFTFTNVGTFGSLMGTPIIHQPQVAILAAGAIKKRPMVVETDQGDSIAIRHMMYLSMSYDHRIIDGALGATFLNAVARELEQFDRNREI